MNHPSREEKNIRYNQWIAWSAHRRLSSRRNNDLIQNDNIPSVEQRHMKLPSTKRPRPLGFPAEDCDHAKCPSIHNTDCFVLPFKLCATEGREERLNSTCSGLPMVPLKRQKTTCQFEPAATSDSCPALVAVTQSSSLWSIENAMRNSLAENVPQERI